MKGEWIELELGEDYKIKIWINNVNSDMTINNKRIIAIKKLEKIIYQKKRE